MKAKAPHQRISESLEALHVEVVRQIEVRVQLQEQPKPLGCCRLRFGDRDDRGPDDDFARLRIHVVPLLDGSCQANHCL